MFFFEKAKTPVYVASRSVASNGVSIYSAPVRYDVSCFTVLPTSTSADLREVGTRFSGYKQIAGDPEYLKNIKPLDRVYVDNVPPTDTDQLASGADYVVHRVVTTLECTTIVIRLVDENG